MDWVKIKPQHVLSNELTTSDVGRLIRFQALVAVYERELTEREIREIFTKIQQISIENKMKIILKLTEFSLNFIQKKVLEDVKIIKKLKEKNKQKMRKYRENDSNVTSNVTVTSTGNVTEHRREEEIREEKNNIYIPNLESFKEIWNKEFKGTSIPLIISLTKERKNKLKVRLNNDKKFKDKFIKCIELIKKNGFLCGDNDRGWVCSFDFVIANDTNYCKILEGGFDSKNKSKSLKQRALEEENVKK